MNVLCFDIGGTQIKAMIKSETEEIELEGIKSRASEGAGPVKEDILAYMHKIVEEYDIDGVAISTAGMVDPATMTIAYANENFKNYIGFDWPNLIKEEFNLPAAVENDVKSAALGEYYYGSGKDFDSLFALTVGTGVGGAMIMDGKVYRGASGQAGEIGYMPMDGTVLDKAGSTSSLINRGKEIYPEKAYENGLEIFEAIDNGESEAIDLMDHLTSQLAIGISNIMLIANPSLILIGGGISEQKEKFIDPIKEKIRAIVPANIYDSTTITSTSLGNKSGMYGAYQNFLAKYKGE